MDLTGTQFREKRARARIIAEAEKAALRNVANLDWAMRQNIEDSFRRFEGIVTALEACGTLSSPVVKRMTKISYRGYRFPPEIIQQAIWLYLRFTLSLRDVEDLLAEREKMLRCLTRPFGVG